MGTGAHAARHAGSLYARLFRWGRHPVQTVESEVHHLHEIERVGESGEAPFIAILGVFLFLLPIGAFMMAVAFGAYYLAR